ncbi:MAG: protein translocase subunit SecD [Gemmatimonadetes bacterium]|jgi:SecD/SecF fusion protein|nr:protein translocase subunit SecD [Gemmatimonadota bacterium]MBT4612877.1 protein translocase subunit SecD [Gemmatimonadota bacterium]MBT5056585.1 protein translocase subunit SecD [Gemmatimonadota bacterium]MBT5145233.1 protein translocase subunit SecD [Gemmatimonadota bacterium]MBT5589614.1 protein translocase subunit SecD [Gemmatimonadota bacterium]
MKQNWKPLLILALLVAAVLHLYPTVEFYGMEPAQREALEHDAPASYYDMQRKAINLGLDLQGGIHLVMEVVTEGLSPEEARDAVDRAQEVIRNRVDQFGVAEPTIQRQGETRIIVELPGLQDVERAKNLIGQTALLEFQLVEPDEDRDRLVQRIDAVLAAGRSSDDSASDGDDAQVADAAEASEQAADTTSVAPSLFGQDSEPAESGLFDADAETAADAADDSRRLLSRLARVGSEVAVMQRDLAAVKAMLTDERAQAVIPDDVEFLFTSKPEGPEGNKYYMLYLARTRPEMTGNMIADAQVSIGQSVDYMGQPIVDLRTTDEGVRLFRRITGAHIQDRLAIVLDGAVYSAPTIQTKIMDGRSIITGSGTQEEAKDLAIVLRAGALPAKVEIIEDRTVGPSLGHDSIEQGRIAGLISLLAVAVFMILYYRVAGAVADIALTLNMVFVMAVLAGFHATLTLPGIAGIILTIGMAVDANVLIFERIREELRTGKTVRAAIDSGYSNALSAIVDANITTFMVGIVLYEFGTGPIRGFALTLCIGIVSSLFTAFVVTRAILGLITSRSTTTSLSIGPIDLLSKSAIPFIGMRKIALLCSAAVLTLGLVSIGTINGLKPGIDFAGGTLLELHFDPPVEIEDIRQQLRSVDVGGQTADLSASEIKLFGSTSDVLIRVTEDATGTDVADGIKSSLRAGLAGSIGEFDWVRRQEKVGPRIGEELTGSAIQAVLVSLALILVYMAWRFRQFLYGIAAVVALFHDVLLTLGVLSLLDVEITLAVVAGILAIVGYSLNDTIVVFDRIRENLVSSRKYSFDDLLNVSINECLSRTVVTSLTTLLAVVVLMIWGGEVIRDFTITLVIGIFVGTYSSVFIASPTLYYGHLRAEANQKK